MEGITKNYGSAGDITYQNMKLMDILKNLATTYNSLLGKAKVPEEVWQPDKEFFVRDGTGVISGALDGAAAELTDKAQLVGLGLQLVSDPAKTATDLANFAQKMEWDKARTIAITLGEGLVNYDAGEFDKGGIYAWHATGKVGGSLALNGAALLAVVADVPNALRRASDILADWTVDLSKVRKISGRFPINSQMYAGKKYSFDVNTNPPLQAKYNSNVPTSIKARLDALHAKYPNGVDFDEFGFARFEPYTLTINGKLAKVEVQTAGNRTADFSAADAIMGIDETYRQLNKLTWHHLEDTKTMILVPFDLHSAVKHTGGVGVLKNDINIED
ncbi:HNH endonuclease [Runella sp.]|uniref:HNH endonuclease signature motif containing protein n=1 Tax=Runella sp. TaxID=1960881 RepID=UPI003D0E2D6A